MANPIRRQILEALKDQLETIKTVNGYRQTVDTVDWAARDYHETKQSEMPFIGIVPQREIWADEPGRNVVIWPIDLVVNAFTNTRTSAGVNDLVSDLTDDIRRALYSSDFIAQYWPLGVHMIRIAGLEASDAVPEAASEGTVQLLIAIEVKYSRDVDEL